MWNPCELAFTRTPQTPSLQGGGELVIQTIEAASPAPAAPAIAADVVIPAPNPLAAAAGNLEHMRGEADVAAELDRALPAMAQRVLDLISKNGPALDEAIAAMAGKPAQEERFQPMGGRLGRVAAGDELGRGERPRPARPELPPEALLPLEPPLDLVPPIEHVTIDLAKLDELPAPPSPKPLEEVLQAIVSTPWTQKEGDRLRQEAPVASPAQVQVALGRLGEFERFVGGSFRAVGDRSSKGQATDRDFRRLVTMGQTQQAGPVGAYLVSFQEVYRAYKADYHALLRSRRAMLDRRDPASLLPLITEEELEDYLWRKYGKALRGRLWRLLRTSAQFAPFERPLLGNDRPWYSGGAEPTPDLARAGTFVALTSDEGDLELQKEQGNPWGARGVFNLAAAIRLGRDVVAYDVRSGVLKINGRVVPWSNGVYELPEGARLELADERMQVVSLRGDTVVVRLNGRALVLSGSISGDRPVDSVEGALGTFGAQARGLADLDSWRVSSDASLF